MTPKTAKHQKITFYEARSVEQKWQAIWEKKKLYDTNLKDPHHKKYYNLVMFPYPSGDKLHIGHWYNFAPADSWGRFMRMHGYNVFEPMGFDAFGLPAENYAIKTGISPDASTAKNVKTMIRQLKEMGTMYDWSQTVNTSNPEYYRWTQWIFLQMYKRGLAYKKKAPVNWCPGCNTVLANEQVQDGICERCKSQVVQKNLAQWFWKITDYVEKLLDYTGLDWPGKTIAMQQHWIGKKTGINITYKVADTDQTLAVFTTRPDTNFGATFIVVAPDSEFTIKNAELFPNKKEVVAYIKATAKKTELERMSEGRKKTGVFTGLYAVNDLTKKKMPIYLSDFVLASVGTGNVVGVPGHDLRDFEFAQAMGLEVVRVVKGKDGDASPITKPEQVQEEEGTMVNSGFLDGMDIHVATEKIMDYMEEKGYGKRVKTYRLRDWLISRQRYWGAPIPIVNCAKCGEVAVLEKDLPVVLPRIKNYVPKGKPPLAASDRFMKTRCPHCKGPATREAETMDTFVCSSWYFLRYPCATMKNKPFDPAILRKWGPVDMYIGGPEHACMHLLYARFVNQVLHDAGFVPFKEPFTRLVHQGMVTKDGAKMSKSKGNVVSPDSFVEKYGSDVFRMYLMFMGPFTQGADWNDKGITGLARFVQKLWTVVTTESVPMISPALLRQLHLTLKRVTDDIEIFHFNTAISAVMEFLNEAGHEGLDQKSKEMIVKMIAPLAPHLAEELCTQLQDVAPTSKKWASVFDQKFPTYDASLTVTSTVELVVQVNGKVRSVIQVAKDISKEDAFKVAQADESVKRNLEGKTILKEIFVPGRLVNFVVK